MLNELEIFLTIAKSQSLAEAGRALKMSSATVARKLSSLEDTIGTKLIERNTRSLSLTSAGLHCYQYCESIPQIIDEMKNTINQNTHQLKGVLNVNIACYSAFDELMPKLIAFNNAYPGIVLNITKSNIFPDLVDESYDVYFRYSEVSTRSLTSTRLIDHQLCVCASDEYLKNTVAVTTPYDILKHRCIVHRYNKYDGDEWFFSIKGKLQAIRIHSTLILNNSALVLEAVKQSGGLAYLPSYLIQGDHTLTTLLKPYWPAPNTVYMTYPRGKHIYEKTRVFVDFILQSYQ